MRMSDSKHVTDVYISMGISERRDPVQFTRLQRFVMTSGVSCITLDGLL
jgi:hypothetical protein